MKQIVNGAVTQMVSIENHCVNSDKYYGVEVLSATGRRVLNKCFLKQVTYSSKSHQLVCVEGLTRCNGYSSTENILNGDLNFVIKKMLDDGTYNVYEFDDPKNFFDWLLK